MLTGKIKNLKYSVQLSDSLRIFDYNTNVNGWDSRCIVRKGKNNFVVSKWVSPKRTRSYPYARVYDMFGKSIDKKITIIPLVKDEGLDGDRDYLNWSTISLMSLLNVYVILAYYVEAEPSIRISKRLNKITKQKFDSTYIKKQISKLEEYHSSALHWNLSQVSPDNLKKLMDKVILSYSRISENLNIKMHSQTGLQNLKVKISKSREHFIQFSKAKSKDAQHRETRTIQPKESVGIGKKRSIDVENYLGGIYNFTVDDVIVKKSIYHLIESKHSRTSLLPSIYDIKDGLLKLILFSNIDQLYEDGKKVDHQVFLRLTSTKLKGRFKSGVNNIDNFIKTNRLHNKSELLKKLIIEGQKNNFGIIIESSK